MFRPPPSSTLFPYTTLFRSSDSHAVGLGACQLKGHPVIGVRRHIAENPCFSIQNGNHDVHLAIVEKITNHCAAIRSEEHTSELQSHSDLVCRLLLEKKKNTR